VLRAFTGGKDGKYLDNTLRADGMGNLYGTAADGGYVKHRCDPYGCGTVFRITP